MRQAAMAMMMTGAMAPAASAEVATFDDLTEGFTPTVMTSGGVTFSHGLWFPGSVDLTFGIDDASGDFPALGYGSLYSGPNVMTVGGFVTGPQSAFFRVHSWQATTGEFANFASVDVFYIDDFPETTVALQAWMGGQLVATDSFMITESNPGTSLHQNLSVSGVMFDHIQFIATGGIFPGDANGILGVFDDVEISIIPAPGVGAAMMVGLMASRRRRG